jgi:hypothetical protein
LLQIEISDIINFKTDEPNPLVLDPDLHAPTDRDRCTTVDFFDRHGITLNREDLRRVNKHRLGLFSPLALSPDGNDGRELSLVGRSDFKSE